MTIARVRFTPVLLAGAGYSAEQFARAELGFALAGHQ
jgi:hypothetical protein